MVVRKLRNLLRAHSLLPTQLGQAGQQALHQSGCCGQSKTGLGSPDPWLQAPTYPNHGTVAEQVALWEAT